MLFFETFFFFFKQTPANISVKLFHATEESSSQVENMDIPKEVRYPSCVFFSAMSSLGENVSYFGNHAKFSKRIFFIRKITL